MRVTVTAVSSATRRRADVVIDADLDTPVAEIAAGLDSILNGGVLSRQLRSAGPRAIRARWRPRLPSKGLGAASVHRRPAGAR
jgi:hypothetical protein